MQKYSAMCGRVLLVADETKRRRLRISQRILHRGCVPQTGQAIEAALPRIWNCTKRLINLT
jgi:hypothetical protein